MIEKQIEEVLEAVRPMLALHRGGVDFVSFDDKTRTVNLKLKGTCQGCPLSELTLKGGIEEMLRAKIPEVLKVEAVEN